ncbi:GMC family oxidoreductase [Parathalassolituus penaei]|uniref:GMC family oxidoreductase N-terminal domain-containing protein n=1 Tax=Parathalassolituus penaei TaxID=2997323 RepID=A0A9X3ISC8_9GAMM|nr:GMC family oxidoreductase N-terminal domain-containing protein [Parathalassolituus penaei]MCY0966232.1 GMC family oxidoreductase N-terminal domain-containing protein [Parathalassolituus penaei]
MSSAEFDYVIAGAGSAGCVVATRLVQAGHSVLLLEAGEKDDSLFHKIPATVVKVFQQKSWPYMTLPQAECNNRSMLIAQGKVLGGGSSVNGMIYIRGQRQDYDDWARDWGCDGWAYEDVLPFFRRCEANESLGDRYHGETGPVHIGENRYRHPLTQACIRACEQMGLPYTNDFNGASQQGTGFYQTNIKNGERQSTSQTYLKSLTGNPKLTVITHALVHKVCLDNSASKATGVQYSVKGGAVVEAKARKEVIVSAGAFGSPKILLLSGIGPSQHLKDKGIQPLHDLPVGKNFHDHQHMSINATTKDNISIYEEDKGFSAVKHMLQWLWTRSGLMTSNILEGGAFIATDGSDRPDVQFHFLPLLDNFDNTPGEKPEAEAHGVSIKVGHLRSKSRGEVRLLSSNPADLVEIDAQILSHPDDLKNQVRAVKTALTAMEQPALKRLIKRVIEPDNISINDDKALETFVRQNIKTVYHPGGTCKLGQNPQDSVVDLQLRVHGVPNLRVIDMSICPQVPSGNTNAVAMMIGERGADLILHPENFQRQPSTTRETLYV